MQFSEMLMDLRDTTSSKDKVEILRRGLNDPDNGEFIKFMLVHTYTPTILHHTILRKKDFPKDAGVKTLEDLQSVVRQTMEVISANHSNVENRIRIKALMERLCFEDQEALFLVVNKNLRCGISIKTINKALPDLIPAMPIQLANKYDPDKVYSNKVWYCSPKMDGVRVFALKRDNEPVVLYSRAKDFLGTPIETLEHWKQEIEDFMWKHHVNFMDGEAYSHGMKFEEIQSLVSSRVNLKDTTPLSYHVFSAGRLNGTTSNPEISVIAIEEIPRLFKKFSSIVGVVQKEVYNRPFNIFEALEEAVNDGYEGIMLRSPDNKYTFKRSNDLLKVKSSDLSGTEEVIDCYVEDLEYGDFVVREDGKESVEQLPVRLLVVMNDDPTAKQMKVGSGFSLQNRRDWADDETLILHKTIEVECQGLGIQGRMRFPRFKRIREDV
jgi:ATP-dependent DNA ligase